MTNNTIALKDKLNGTSWVTLRDGVVVSAVSCDPRRFLGLSEAQARHLARYGSLGRKAPK